MLWKITLIPVMKNNKIIIKVYAYILCSTWIFSEAIFKYHFKCRIDKLWFRVLEHNSSQHQWTLIIWFKVWTVKKTIRDWKFSNLHVTCIIIYECVCVEFASLKNINSNTNHPKKTKNDTFKNNKICIVLKSSFPFELNVLRKIWNFLSER